MATFRYRSESLRVPTRWLARYLADHTALMELIDRGAGSRTSYGLVSSASSAEAELWSDFLASLSTFYEDEQGGEGRSLVTYAGLIGCYNLPVSVVPTYTSQFCFWRDTLGPAYYFHLFSYALLDRFSARLDTVTRNPSARKTVDDPVGHTPDDFVTFVRTILSGAVATRREQDERCSLQVNYRSQGRDYGRPGLPADRLHASRGCESDYSCFNYDVDPDADEACGGLGYDDWAAVWNDHHYCVEADNPEEEDGAGGRPAVDCTFHGEHTAWTINFHAAHLCFQGLVLDVLMDLGRLALDYASYIKPRGGPAGAAEVFGWRMGRYALNLCARNARHHIHELGHAWLAYSDKQYAWSGDHCDYNCSNDQAANHWFCAARAAFGLPHSRFHASRDDATGALIGDFDPSTSNPHEDVQGCSRDPGAHLAWSCHFGAGENGVPNQTGYYCATGCLIVVESLSGNLYYDIPPTIDGVDARLATASESDLCFALPR